MLTAVDHIIVHVPQVAHAVETFRRLGFTLTHGTSEEAAYAVFGDFYLEFRDDSTAGYHELVVRSDNLDADIARLQASGVSVTDPVDDPLDGRGGSLSRRSVTVDAHPPISLIEHHHDPDDRQAFLDGTATHPNNATTLERTYISVESIEQELSSFERILGVPAPEPEMGTVIMSLMSVFYFGETGIAVAEPRGPGPTADALRADGPSLFQVLFRADHLDETAQLIVENGMPPPERGTRLGGEGALLIEPTEACNIYVAMAGSP